ncbi:ABC subfamily G member 8 [Rhyzopertha dominica]|nr:ABC subfamily G member 8 [Rhyzopertha dominica]
MVRSRTPSQGGGSQGFEMERKYSVPSNPDSRAFSGTTSEDLHAWSIYRQNLNSDFTDSALGSTDKSPLPYGNFQLRDTTVQSILSHPRYGPKSALGSNMYTYLKFGLPRVFPPNHNGSHRSGTPQHFSRGTSVRPTQTRVPKSASRGPRDGSSGYDSSDNETSNYYKQSRKYRSDPDFRMQSVHQSYHPPQGSPRHVPVAPVHQNNVHTTSRQWSRNKSVSEANLLAPEYSFKNTKDPRRASVADFGHHHHDVVDHSAMSHIGRPQSKADFFPHMDHPRRGTSMIRGDYLMHDEDDVAAAFIYPHLQVCGIGLWPDSSSVCFGRRHHLLINDISFEIRGGEIMALMATSEEEGTALLDVVAGLRTPVVGDVILNGQNVKARSLRNRVAYVQNDSHLCKDMTALQTLRFHYDLKKPTDKLGHLKIDAMDRINVLIEDLGLEQVRNTKVANMTISERRRLNVACHLLLDTDIVVLDQPTRGMDIFDTFFLVEYLRQWANGGAGNSLGRIVILTLHPPTYEIFTMLSRILLISAGRTMFSGRRRDMLSYFAMVEYPCPSFKNPSDYYLDLVTLDDLSAEAMLESSQRIEQLAEIFRQKQPPMSDPGPPSSLPMTIKKSNVISQGFVLFTKAMIYTQPNTFISWLTLIIMSVSLSLIMGAIFWDIPNTDQELLLNDRNGFHYSSMCVMIWPVVLYLTILEVLRNKRTVERDVRDDLYGRFTYIFTKTLVNLPPSLFVWLIYLVPSYSMCGLYMQSAVDYEGFYTYLGVMLIYLSCIQIFILAWIYMIPLTSTATILSSTILTTFFLIAGNVLHYRDFTVYVEWLKYVSPTSWLLPYLLNRELTQEAIESSSTIKLCRSKQIQHQDIIVSQRCETPNGTQVLFNFGYLNSQNQFYDYGNPIIAMVVFYAVCFVIASLAFVMNCCRSSTKKQHTGDTNRP